MEPELLQPSNILIRARHNDEKLHGGDEHEHAIGVPLTKDGRYNGGKMLNHMKNNFNTNSARHMRERGWDMEDLNLYDPSRKDDEEYMAERREKRRKQGRCMNVRRNNTGGWEKIDMRFGCAIIYNLAVALIELLFQRPGGGICNFMHLEQMLTA